MPKITFKFDVTKCIQENEKKKKKALAMLKSEIIRTTEPYVPFDKGELARSVYSSINDGTDQISKALCSFSLCWKSHDRKDYKKGMGKEV